MARRSALVLALALALVLATPPARAQSAEIEVSIADETGRPIEDAVVVALPPEGKVTMPPRAREELVDQVDKEFSPKVKPVLVGTAVRFPNRDNVRHHVYSFSGAKRFELPLYAGVPAQPIVFDRPGVVVLGCNIHDWMVGYIYVSESPYFAKTGRDGKATLAGLPQQVYLVRAWHPQLEGPEDATRKTVDLTRIRRVEASWTLALKPEIKVRRSPVAGHGSHY